MPTCDRCEIGERQRIFSSVSFSTYSQCRIHYCYTGGFVSAGATYPCRATRKSGVCGQHLRIRRSVQFILAGAVRYNVPRICAALLCRALRRVNRLCSSTLSVDCEYFAKITQESPDCRSPFPAYAVYRLHPSYPNKGKVGVQRGRETAGVPSFLPPRRAPQSPALRRAQLPAEVQRKTPAR